MGHKKGANMKLFFLGFLISFNLFAGQIFIGDTVIDPTDQIGVVQNVYNNGKVVVNINGYNLVRMANELSLSVTCSQKFCVEDTVASRPHYGSVLQVFENGKVKFLSNADHYPKIRRAQDLALGVTCFKGACEGDAVIDAANLQGTILRVFDDGYALVNFPYQGVFFRAIAELGF
jgi:hypothetical protein